HAKHPVRFGLVKPVDPNDPGVADTIADWKATNGTVGIRIMMRDTVSPDPADPGINRVLAAPARHSLAVNLLCWGRLEQAAQLAARNPNTQLVIDHLGLQQPFEPPPPAQPWAELPKVLALAAYPNIAIKISGACTLSHQQFPYNDIWDPLGRIRSEEHTSELQSLAYLVCRLLLEKKKKKQTTMVLVLSSQFFEP